MLLLASWVLFICTFKALVNKQFLINQFVFRGWMAIPFLLFGILSLAKLFFNYNLVTNLPIIELVALFLLIIPFCFLNRKQLSVVLVTIGIIFNTLALAFNSNYMPVDPNALIKFQGDLYLKVGYVFWDSDTKLPLLTDWLYFPYAGIVFSPGDALIYLGLLILVIQYEKFRRNQTGL